MQKIREVSNSTYFNGISLLLFFHIGGPFFASDSSVNSQEDENFITRANVNLMNVIFLDVSSLCAGKGFLQRNSEQ